MWPLPLMSRPAVKMALGRPPRSLILLLVQVVALTSPVLRKESPATSPAELIVNAALEEPPERVPRLVMAPVADHCTATKLVASCPLTFEYPTTIPVSLMPRAPLTVAPESVSRSFMPPLWLQ